MIYKFTIKLSFDVIADFRPIFFFFVKKDIYVGSSKSLLYGLINERNMYKGLSFLASL